MSGKFSVRLLYETMHIQRNSFYHWKKRFCDPTPKTTALADNITAMESISGWIKSELFTDFHLPGENIMEEIAAYIKYFNGKRPAYDKLIKIPASALVRLRVIGDITL